MSNAALKRIDCRGMQCPTPILHIATAARSAGSLPTLIEVLADDTDFLNDVEAWCRKSKSQLIGLTEVDGIIQARIAINGAGAAARAPAPPAQAAPQSGRQPRLDQAPSGGRPTSARPPQVHHVDCRGMRCPAPILALSKFARSLRGEQALIEVIADDAEFPADLRAWCRTTGTQLLEVVQTDSGILARLSLHSERSATGSSRPIANSSLPPAPLPVAIPANDAGGREVVDLRGLHAPTPIIQLSSMLAQRSGQSIMVLADDPTFMSDVMAWATATKVAVTSAAQDGGVTQVVLQLGPTAAHPTSMVAKAPVSPPAFVPVAALPPTQSTARVPAGQEQEDRMTVLVIRNDFESLMAAMLCATTAAAQGMQTSIYFSFWGVNMLRGERPRKSEGRSRASFLQRMMKWMMPKGPKRQKMSKMHMGGMGKGMMQYFMRKNNVMSLEQMIESAVQQNVRFVVCTMSMGIMGIEKRDLMELPNIDYAGVTSFVELSQRSKSTLVF